MDTHWLQVLPSQSPSPSLNQASHPDPPPTPAEAPGHCSGPSAGAPPRLTHGAAYIHCLCLQSPELRTRTPAHRSKPPGSLQRPRTSSWVPRPQSSQSLEAEPRLLRPGQNPTALKSPGHVDASSARPLFRLELSPRGAPHHPSQVFAHKSPCGDHGCPVRNSIYPPQHVTLVLPHWASRGRQSQVLAAPAAQPW